MSDDTFTLPTEAGPKTVRLIEPRRSARCQHRDPADPLPCPVPSCPAGHRRARLAVVFADVAEDGSDGRVGSFRAVRKFDAAEGRWVWRPA